MSLLGTPASPFVVAPEDFDEKGLPYGACCVCDRCGTVRRSTHVFDFYADGPGLPLKCEICVLYDREA